ncbi:MAG TPA: cell envelope integrity EipB family protein [Hyphomicrobiales bacterium]|nr:cell envelope integrity EipB family protein [Hyphomicrobiales bacterium]
MKLKKLTFLGLSLAGLVSWFQSASAQIASAKTGELAAHRAVYELTLDQTAPGSNVTDIRGELVYDFSGSSCQGYTLNTQLVTEIFDREGKPSKTDIRSETKEDGDGKRFRFTTNQYVNGKLTEGTKGFAYRNPRREGIVVELEKPRRATFSLFGHILFPTQHSLAILKTALAGQTRLSADIYDGSEKGAKVYETSTIIGPPLELAANGQLPAVKNAETLDQIPSWPVVVSYYDPGPKKDGLPSYEVSFRMFANGVSRKLKLDYGTFSLNGELTAIDFLPTKPCP